MQLTVRTATGSEDFQLEVEPFYTALDVKKQIEFLHDISWNNQFLVYESVILSDDDTLADYDVQHGDQIHLVQKEHPFSLQLFLKDLNGITNALNVEPFYTIEDINLMILCRLHIPPDQQRLIYGGRQLQCGKTLKDSGIHEDATLHLVLKLRGS